jgi:aryl-alcohol dehydrogenase-like predicted oxidoreductase
MLKRRLGLDLEVSSIGIGCMPMAGGMTSYGACDDTESIATIRHAIELGITFFDTAELYGPYHSEEVLGRAIEGMRNEVVIATKFGFTLADGKLVGLDGTPANARRACDASLRRLGVERIDLFYLHRADPAVPIEETVVPWPICCVQVKSAQLGFPKWDQSRCARRIRCTRSRRCSPSIHYGSAV